MNTEIVSEEPPIKVWLIEGKTDHRFHIVIDLVFGEFYEQRHQIQRVISGHICIRIHSEVSCVEGDQHIRCNIGVHFMSNQSLDSTQLNIDLSK